MIDTTAKPGWAVRCRRRLLRIAPRELEFERRGFRGGRSGMRERIEGIGASFAAGYHAALEDAGFVELDRALGGVALEARGFAFEGAAMGLAILDWLTPWNRHRVRGFLQGVGDPHAYMVHVGVGWALARLPMRVDAVLGRFDSRLRWLILDGWGFHQGFFHARTAIEGRPSPACLRGYARRAFDQGLGRCLWFINGGDLSLLLATIARYESGRHHDLWSGLGLACAYAGGVTEPEELEDLRRAAGAHRSALAQGAAFAAKARLRADTPASHTEAVCRILCGRSAGEAAAVTDQALVGLPDRDGREDAADPAYEVWRRRVQSALVPAPVAQIARL